MSHEISVISATDQIPLSLNVNGAGYVMNISPIFESLIGIRDLIQR